MALPRVILISDGAGELRRLLEVAAAAWQGGIRAIQVREPAWNAVEILRACEGLRALYDGTRGLLLANDRADLAAAGVADGVQVGSRSLPVALVRRAAGPKAWLGFSAHREEEPGQAARDGADFALLSPVFATPSKPWVPPLGLEALGRAAGASPIPVLALGGMDATRAREARARGAHGVACIGAVFRAADPEGAARDLVEAVG